MPQRPIAVDLGTTRSVIATFGDGRPVVIPNRYGRLTTPSVVAFTASGKPLVGQSAQRQAMANPERTMTAVKRLLGTGHRFHLDGREYAPEQISAYILRRLKIDGERWLGEPIEEAVITVPAYFNERQREATRKAGLLAGLKAIHLVNEPTAAALAYGLHREDVQTIMVWDLGGGTFDVAILELGEGAFEVRAVGGDGSLGGIDFDQRLVQHLADEYRQAHGTDFPADARAHARLCEAAERAKVALSAEPRTDVFIPFVERSPRPRHLALTLTQERLELLLADLLQRLVPPTLQALADANLSPAALDRVILAGNGTRMPAVRKLLARLLAKEPYRYLDADLVTAMGAAIHAGVLAGHVDRVVLLDSLPLSLGVESQGGLFARLIPRNTTLPASASRLFSTATDGQTSMRIRLLQGERELAMDNVILGDFELEELPAAPRGTVRVEVILDVDADGVVRASAHDLLADQEAAASFSSSKLLAPEEVTRLVNEAQALARQDLEDREQIEAAIEAENAIAAGEMALAELARRCSPDRLEELVDAIWHVREAVAGGSAPEVGQRCSELRRALASAHALVPEDPPRSQALAERAPSTPDVHVQGPPGAR